MVNISTVEPPTADINTLAASYEDMKHTIYILVIAILSSCGQSSPVQKSGPKNSVSGDTIKDDQRIVESKNQEQIKIEPAKKNDIQNETVDFEFKNAIAFQLTDTITADFNGDGQEDQAIFKKEDGTSGIHIKHGQTDEEIKIGFGKKFAHLTEFNWVDFWGLVKDSATYEIIIEDAEITGDTIVRLENPSIFVRKDEVGGGIVTFRNGKYKWIHQAD